MTRKPVSKKVTTVLFIDDEARWLDAVRMSVHDKKFRIITADSGEAALAKLRRRTPDLILSDVRMPVMNGFDLFEMIKRDPKLRGIPYVFMSSLDDYDAKNTARKLGADGYVEKPWDSDEVRHVVTDLLDKFSTKPPLPKV
jgi:response regulator RpfG family c-di-GMP phosphodiesterase